MAVVMEDGEDGWFEFFLAEIQTDPGFLDRCILQMRLGGLMYVVAPPPVRGGSGAA